MVFTTNKTMQIMRGTIEKWHSLAKSEGLEIVSKSARLANQRNLVVLTFDDEPVGVIKGQKFDELPKNFKLEVTGLTEDGFEINLIEEEANAPTKPADGISEEMKQLINKTAAHAKMSRKDVRARVEYMSGQHVADKVISNILKTYQKRDHRHEPKVLYQDTNGELQLALINSSIGRATMLKGPKSTGKNVMIESVAYCFATDYYRKSLDTRSIAEDLFGSKSTDNSAAEELKAHPELAEAYLQYSQGREDLLEDAAKYVSLKAQAACIRLVFEPSDFVKWAVHGGVLNADELNFWPTDLVQEALNGAADGEGVITNANTGTMHLNPGCILMAGLNPGYTGTLEINEATESRFSVLLLDYPKSIKKQLAANFSGKDVPEAYFDQAEAFYASVIKAVKEGTITDKALNIRGIVGALQMVFEYEGIVSFQEALQICVINAADADERMLLTALANAAC